MTKFDENGKRRTIIWGRSKARCVVFSHDSSWFTNIHPDNVSRIAPGAEWASSPHGQEVQSLIIVKNHRLCSVMVGQRYVRAEKEHAETEYDIDCKKHEILHGGSIDLDACRCCEKMVIPSMKATQAVRGLQTAGHQSTGTEIWVDLISNTQKWRSIKRQTRSQHKHRY